jgi:crotonobetainyl-CoA:carnitine CoA-transferase CaiB-like acyl-CoA transferase
MQPLAQRPAGAVAYRVHHRAQVLDPAADHRPQRHVDPVAALAVAAMASCARKGGPPAEPLPELALPAPTLGQHGHEILAEAGYDAAAIEALTSTGVVPRRA